MCFVWETTSGFASALSTYAWFDSGYKFVQSTKAQDAWHHCRNGSEGQLRRDTEAALVADLSSGLC